MNNYLRITEGFGLVVKQHRSLNTIDAIALTVGSMVGAGIFTILSLTVRTAGPFAVLAWVLIVLLSFPMALSFSDLTGVLAESGGPYVYVKMRTRPWFGLWVAWSFLLSSIGAAGALFISFVGMLSEAHVPHSMVVGLIVLVVLTVILGKGIHLGALVGRFLTLLTVVLLVTATVIGFTHAKWLPDVRMSGLAHHVSVWSVIAPHGFLAVLPATFYAFWTYSGWEAVAVPSGSYRTKKSLGRGMLIGSILVGVLYIAVALGTSLSIPTHVIGTHVNPLVFVAALTSKPMGTMVSFGAIVVVMGSLLSWLIASASLLQSLCRDGLIPAPQRIKQWSGEYHPSLPYFAALVLVVMAYLPVFSAAIAASSLTALVPYAVVFAMVALDRRANWEGAFKSTRTRRTVAFLAFVVAVILVAFSGWSNLWPTALLLGIGGLTLWLRKLSITSSAKKIRDFEVMIEQKM